MQRFRNNFGIASHLSSFLHLSMPLIDFVGPASFCYQFNKKNLHVTRLGLEPKTPTLKVLCSTN